MGKICEVARTPLGMSPPVTTRFFVDVMYAGFQNHKKCTIDGRASAPSSQVIADGGRRDVVGEVVVEGDVEDGHLGAPGRRFN